MRFGHPLRWAVLFAMGCAIQPADADGPAQSSAEALSLPRGMIPGEVSTGGDPDPKPPRYGSVPDPAPWLPGWGAGSSSARPALNPDPSPWAPAGAGPVDPGAGAANGSASACTQGIAVDPTTTECPDASPPRAAGDLSSIGP